MEKNTALVLGATGLIGSQLLQQLVDDDRWQEVRVVGRRAPELPADKVTFFPSELAEITQRAAHAFEGVDVVFNCLGTTLKKAGSRQAFKAVDMDAVLSAGWLARAKQVPVFASVSAYGADPSSRVFYSRIKGLVEQRLSELGFPRLIFMQPSLLLGERQEFRFGERLADRGWALVEPWLGSRLSSPWRPVDAAAVARAMATVVLEQGAPGVQRLRFQDIQQRQ